MHIFWETNNRANLIKREIIKTNKNGWQITFRDVYSDVCHDFYVQYNNCMSYALILDN